MKKLEQGRQLCIARRGLMNYNNNDNNNKLYYTNAKAYTKA